MLSVLGKLLFVYCRHWATFIRNRATLAPHIIFLQGIQELPGNTRNCRKVVFLITMVACCCGYCRLFQNKSAIYLSIDDLKEDFFFMETALWEIWFILRLYEFFSAGYALGWVETCSVCCRTDKYVLHKDGAVADLYTKLKMYTTEICSKHEKSH